MAIVIGAATRVNFEGTSCIISASWGFNPNAQRLYCIGSWSPSSTFLKPTETLNITLYSPGPRINIEPTTSCSDANTVSASVSPTACGEDLGSLSGSWMVTSYSYSKEDATMPGQESWSLTKWKGLNTSVTYTPPTYILRGIAEGQATGEEAGVEFIGDTVTTSNGNVSAGGFGKADILQVGVISHVGGGSSDAGVTGQGSASIPYTPVYI